MDEFEESEEEKKKNKITELEFKKNKISNINDSAIQINNAEKKNNEKILIFESDLSNNSYNASNSNYISNDSSTFDSSKSNIIDNNISISFSSNNNQNVNKFNSIKNNYYENNKLYDIKLVKNSKNINLPLQYRINEKNFAFVYPNNLVTYIICISGYMVKDEKIFKENIFDESCGLQFCGKNIEIKTKINKNCRPNVFLCKECMQKNKKLYNIKKKYLININGRIAKINKGSYHCFGKFLIGNIIEDCINKFSCMACKLLDQYLTYYQ